MDLQDFAVAYTSYCEGAQGKTLAQWKQVITNFRDTRIFLLKPRFGPWGFDPARTVLIPVALLQPSPILGADPVSVDSGGRPVTGCIELDAGGWEVCRGTGFLPSSWPSSVSSQAGGPQGPHL